MTNVYENDNLNVEFALLLPSSISLLRCSLFLIYIFIYILYLQHKTSYITLYLI